MYGVFVWNYGEICSLYGETFFRILILSESESILSFTAMSDVSWHNFAVFSVICFDQLADGFILV